MDNSFAKGLNIVLENVKEKTKVISMPIMPAFKDSAIDSASSSTESSFFNNSYHIYRNPIHGLVLAQDIVSHFPVPSYPTSIKDGFAVRSSDGPGIYPVIASFRAGHDDYGQEYVLPPKTIAYITTGSPLPAGADAVIEIEQTIDRGYSTGLLVSFLFLFLAHYF